MVNKNKEFIKLMLEKSKEVEISEVTSPFKNVDVEEVENLTKEVLEKKPKK
tara:strand:+ start:696 stop:848 length:153 start_codon:yes stop_codon:yes gene_type:complete